MSTEPTPTNLAVLIADQRTHWEATLAANPLMYGPEPSEPDT